MGKRAVRKETIEFQGYVEVRLDETQKKAFAAWRKENDNLGLLLDKLVEAGYRCSLSWDDYNEAYMASITTKDPQSTNAGWVLVGRGPDCVGAAYQALFKHYVVAKEAWLNIATTSRNDWD